MTTDICSQCKQQLPCVPGHESCAVAHVSNGRPCEDRLHGSKLHSSNYTRLAQEEWRADSAGTDWLDTLAID